MRTGKSTFAQRSTEDLFKSALAVRVSQCTPTATVDGTASVRVRVTYARNYVVHTGTGNRTCELVTFSASSGRT
jgi:hypothetical protein